MATLFKTLFDDFLSTEVNSLNLGNYSPPQLSNYLSILLKRSREEFYNYAYISGNSTIFKMDDVIEFYNQEYLYTFTGVTFTTTLSPLPNSGVSFYITVDGIATTNYTYITSTGVLTLSNMSNLFHNIDVIAFLDGQFNQSLSLVEQGILTDLMATTFLKDKIKEQKLYNMALTGKDEGIKSQANHLIALNKIYREDKKDIEQRMYVYTYQSNPNQLKGLGAKG